GVVIDGSYRIERTIAAGGVGLTYLATDPGLERSVALKEDFPDQFAYRDTSLSVRAKFNQQATFHLGFESVLREARTPARFHHPSVVMVMRVFEANATGYMVMVYERGQSLEEWLRKLRRAPTQDELDRIAGPLLDALALMHGQNFLHRDIAPDNIVIRDDGTP